jgi:hypothetical protein
MPFIGRHPHPILISHVPGSMVRDGFWILGSMQPCQLAWRDSKLGLVFRSRLSRDPKKPPPASEWRWQPCSGHDPPPVHEMRSAAVVMLWGFLPPYFFKSDDTAVLKRSIGLSCNIAMPIPVSLILLCGGSRLAVDLPLLGNM